VVVRIMGNLYGRIKWDGWASCLFGNVSKSMFGWVNLLVLMAYCYNLLVKYHEGFGLLEMGA
jgi:hypothetical protein